MDIYHIWCDLKSGVTDLEFVTAAQDYLSKLASEGQLEAFRITRRKLGLAPSDLGEFHLMLEFNDLGQLDAAFNRVAERREPVEGLHHAVNSLTTSLRFALYRDFPDSGRSTGEELF